tara:strand:+ start:866 stop:1327 length:462 start_codon:yes stop_codon:yes gene_type:complete
MRRHQSRPSKTGFTLVEVIVAVAIFGFAIFAVMELVGQGLQLVHSMQRQRPDLGTLAGKTMMGIIPPDGDLVSGEDTKPFDEDFGGNDGDSYALYPNATWERFLDPIDETNGLYRAAVTVIEQNKDGQETISKLHFLLFRADLAEAEVGAGTQ